MAKRKYVRKTKEEQTEGLKYYTQTGALISSETFVYMDKKEAQKQADFKSSYIFDVYSNKTPPKMRWEFQVGKEWLTETKIINGLDIDFFGYAVAN